MRRVISKISGFLGGLDSPDRWALKLWQRVPGYIRLTYIAALVLGLLTHLYMFTNKFTNHDDLSQMFFADYGKASGRWLLPTVLELDGNFSMPWLIGMLSILCLAGVPCFVVALLRIRQPLGCVVTAALLVTFPTVTATFGFMFSADAYFFSLLLAVFGAYLSVRWGWKGSLLGAVAITLSLGVYQAYLPVAAVLMVGALLFETLDGEASLRALLWKGVRLAATLAVALLAYLVVVRFTTRDTGLTDYEGISDMGKLSLGELPQLVVLSYKKYGAFFLRDRWHCHASYLPYVLLLTALVTVVLGVLLLLRRRIGTGRTLLALFLVGIYPLAGGLIYVMVPKGFVHIHMMYGLVFLLIAPIALMEYSRPVLQEGSKTRVFHVMGSWVILLTMALTAYSYGITDNNAYLKADLGMRQCEAYSNRLLARVESAEGYEPGMPVVLVGSTQREAALSPTPELDASDLVGIFNMGDLRTFYTYGHFLRYYLGFSQPVYAGNSELARSLADTARVQAMPLYPLAGSVQVMDGRVVVKLNP